MHIATENALPFDYRKTYSVYRVSYADNEMIGICKAYSILDIAARFSKEHDLLLVPVRIERIPRGYQKKKEALQKKFQKINVKLDLLEDQRRKVGEMLNSLIQ